VITELSGNVTRLEEVIPVGKVMAPELSEIIVCPGELVVVTTPGTLPEVTEPETLDDKLADGTKVIVCPPVVMVVAVDKPVGSVTGTPL